MTRQFRSLVVPAVAWFLVATLMPAASAQDEISQTASAVARLDVPTQIVELCMNDECESIFLSGSSRELELRLAYSLVGSAQLPAIDASAGTPGACEIKNSDGSVTKRLGVALIASGATFAERSSVQLSQGGKPVKKKANSTGRPTKTDTLAASVCWLATP